MLAHPHDREHAHAQRKGPSDYERDLTARENRVRGRCACGRALHLRRCVRRVRADLCGGPMTGKLYIAGASADIGRAERWIAKAIASGIEVTEDWTAKVRAAGSANTGTVEQLRAAAEACERGVIAASVVWVLVPREERPTAGAWYEMGMARALGARIVVSADWLAFQRCVFTYADGVERFLTDESAFARVVDLCRGGQ